LELSNVSRERACLNTETLTLVNISRTLAGGERAQNVGALRRVDVQTRTLAAS